MGSEALFADRPRDRTCPGYDDKDRRIEALEAELRDALIALERSRRWIPVTEQLPETYVRVLVSDDRGVSIAQREDQVGRQPCWDVEGKWMAYEISEVVERPTHWMPIPSPLETKP